MVSSFDAAYAAYNGFQNGMERYWTLKHLEQAGITELTATLFKDNLVRADTLPLVLPVLGTEGLPRGAQVRVRLGAIDDITLEVSGTVIERLDRPQTDGQDAPNEDEGDDDDSLASPLALAIDLDDNGSEPGAEPRPAPAEPSAAGA